MGPVSTVAETKKPQRVMSKEQIDAMLEREKIVLEHRIKGWSFYRIKRELKIANPDRIFRRAIARDENEPYRRAEAIRLEELRLDELQEGIWPRALSGEPRAVEVALKVLERRARMHGLDFADMISGQLVEVERAKVKLMATALVTALNAIGATAEQRRQATAAFLAELRTVAHSDEVGLVAVGQVPDGYEDDGTPATCRHKNQQVFQEGKPNEHVRCLDCRALVLDERDRSLL